MKRSSLLMQNKSVKVNAVGINSSQRADGMSRVRLDYMDVCKGFAIICIILGHCGWDMVNSFVFTFHVPLFFIISGYFFSTKKPLAQRLGKLIKPYVSTVLVLTLLQLFFTGLSCLRSGFSAEKFVADSLKWLWAGVYGSGTLSPLPDMEWPIIGAVWFLLALGWATVFMYIMARLKWSLGWQFMVSGFLLALGAVTAEYVWLPLSIQAGMASVIFMVAGVALRKHPLWEYPKAVVMCGILWAVSLYQAYDSGEFLCLVSAKLPHHVFDILGALGGSVFIIWIAKNFVSGKVSRFFIFFGEASLVVLCFHLIELNMISGELQYQTSKYLGGWKLSLVITILTFKFVWATFWVKAHKRSRLLQRMF